MAALAAREVILHVYDLHQGNSWLSPIGFGVFHTGLEIGGMEYSFSQEGIFKCAPRQAPPPAKFRESIVLGEHHGSHNEVSQIIREMRDEFAPGTYDLVRKNCNSFTNALSLRITGVPIPTWVNRAASVGSFFLGAMGGAGAPSSQPKNGEAGAAEGGGPDPRKQKRQLTEKQKDMLARIKKGGNGSSS
uniref:PPPDE domain-containing protein n=1 Tax=Rhizochromulina marina TaxID=1034831 RepID=A0A7S2SKP3_9STRA